MADGKHYVIIGNGVAGNRAAAVLRERAPDDRVTIVSMGALLFYNRYELPAVFRGRCDWRDYLVHTPDYYEKNRITVRRNCRVAQVDPLRRVLVLKHREEMHYDRLLIASGGRGYLPVGLGEYAHLLHHFNTYRAAMQTAQALPKGGRVVMLGGDVLGIDLARNLIDTGYRVTLLPSGHCFWPHSLTPEERPRFLDALRRIGIDVEEDGAVERIEEGKGRRAPARRVITTDGRVLEGDVVMAFYGLAPMLDFIAGSGIDIERGLLVSPELHTTDENIWAAGDVCQIWCAEQNAYRFYYGWKNVRAMGEIAALNMTGGSETFHGAVDETLTIDETGAIRSPFWEYD